MTTTELRQLADKIVSDAGNARLDDAAFRRRTQRNAAKMQKLMAAAPGAGRRTGGVARGGQAATSAARYAFVAVPNGSGGTTSVSIVRSTFDELAEALGGRAQVAALARKVATGHKPDSGVSRSAYVLRRLQQRAQRAADAAQRAPATARASGGSERAAGRAERASGGSERSAERGSGRARRTAASAADPE